MFVQNTSVNSQQMIVGEMTTDDKKKAYVSIQAESELTQTLWYQGKAVGNVSS